jgi:hypothetical protein
VEIENFWGATVEVAFNFTATEFRFQILPLQRSMMRAERYADPHWLPAPTSRNGTTKERSKNEEKLE